MDSGLRSKAADSPADENPFLTADFDYIVKFRTSKSHYLARFRSGYCLAREITKSRNIWAWRICRSQLSQLRVARQLSKLTPFDSSIAESSLPLCTK